MDCETTHCSCGRGPLEILDCERCNAMKRLDEMRRYRLYHLNQVMAAEVKIKMLEAQFEKEDAIAFPKRID